MAVSKSNLMAMKGGGGDPTAERAAKLKADWNKFVDFLQAKGVKGNPALDSGVGDGNVGIQYVKEFQKLNPTTTITPQTIPEVQGHFQNYREYTLNKLRNKQAMITDAKNPNGRYVTPDENLDYYMKDLSKVDGIPGQRTTNWKFPESFLTTVYKAPGGAIEKKVTVNQGLAQ